jgi:hypothetical protein
MNTYSTLDTLLFIMSQLSNVSTRRFADLLGNYSKPSYADLTSFTLFGQVDDPLLLPLNVLVEGMWAMVVERYKRNGRRARATTH